MIIDCISDLHGHYPELEGGDLLIVAGDLTRGDTKEEHIQFSKWLAQQDYLHKIVIAGNHDNQILLLGRPVSAPKVDYLCDSGTEFEGLRIWGPPWTKRFPGMNPNAMAFTVETEEELAEKWALIPEDTVIHVTHCPPYGIRDGVKDYSARKIFCVGSESLLFRVHELKENLKLHVFGHIHKDCGVKYPRTPEDPKFGKRPINIIMFINASHVNERYEPVNKPIRISL